MLLIIGLINLKNQLWTCTIDTTRQFYGRPSITDEKENGQLGRSTDAKKLDRRPTPLNLSLIFVEARLSSVDSFLRVGIPLTRGTKENTSHQSSICCATTSWNHEVKREDGNYGLGLTSIVLASFGALYVRRIGWNNMVLMVKCAWFGYLSVKPSCLHVIYSLGLLGLPADHIGDQLALPLGHCLALLLAADGAHWLSDCGAVCDSSVSVTWLGCGGDWRQAIMNG